MTMRLPSMSVLPSFLLAALSCSITLPAAAQNRPQEEAALSNRVEETVSKLLSVPVYTASDEKLLNQSGDAAALAITKIAGQHDMNSPDAVRRIILVLHLAFEAPQSMVEPTNKTPTAALRLLNQLERTDYGRQPNVVGNLRYEIEHNTSTGQPLQFVTLPGEPVIDEGHHEWLGTVLEWIATIKPGMTRSDLLKVFTTEGGLSTRTHRTYVLKQYPFIKVDVDFSIAKNEAEDKIVQISRPYLAYSIMD